MTKENNRQLIVALLVLTIIISAIGTYALLSGIGPITQEGDQISSMGKVRLFVMNIAEPDDEEATVKLNVVNTGG